MQTDWEPLSKSRWWKCKLPQFFLTLETDIPLRHIMCSFQMYKFLTSLISIGFQLLTQGPVFSHNTPSLAWIPDPSHPSQRLWLAQPMLEMLLNILEIIPGSFNAHSPFHNTSAYVAKSERKCGANSFLAYVTQSWKPLAHGCPPCWH